ncbi:hypothetical protein HDU67_002797 [Dinochytrium kinnereticum]|nr:hypothetical protein HDU67_002797 [Dinochytrium kinnereticum]
MLYIRRRRKEEEWPSPKERDGQNDFGSPGNDEAKLIGASAASSAAAVAADSTSIGRRPSMPSVTNSGVAGVAAGSAYQAKAATSPPSSAAEGTQTPPPAKASVQIPGLPTYTKPFTLEQYIAAGWTMEQINIVKPPILPSSNVRPLSVGSDILTSTPTIVGPPSAMVEPVQSR